MIYVSTTMLLTLILNIATIVQLRRQSKKSKQIRSTSDEQKRSLRRMTVMLLAVSLSFIAFGAPSSFMQSYVRIKYNDSYKTTDEPSIVQARYFIILLEQLNFCTNFFFYVCCSQTFRREMRRMLCGRCRPAAEEKPTLNLSLQQTTDDGKRKDRQEPSSRM